MVFTCKSAAPYICQHNKHGRGYLHGARDIAIRATADSMCIPLISSNLFPLRIPYILIKRYPIHMPLVSHSNPIHIHISRSYIYPICIPHVCYIDVCIPLRFPYVYHTYPMCNTYTYMYVCYTYVLHKCYSRNHINARFCNTLAC